MSRPSPARRAAALAVLGLPAHASAAQVTAAYRRLARATHPDATGRTDAEAGAGFARVSEAYHLLSPAGADEEPTSVPVESRARVGARRAGGARRFARRPPIVAGPVTVVPEDPDSGSTR